MGVDPPTSTESSWESTPPTSTESSWQSTLTLLQKAVRVDRNFYRKYLGVDPLTSTECSWESSLQKAVGSRPSHFLSSWESTLSLLQKVVGSRPSYSKAVRVLLLLQKGSRVGKSNLLLRQKAVTSSRESTLSLQKAVGSRHSQFYRSSWESTLSLLQKVVGSRTWESRRTSHFYRKQLGVDPLTSTESWESLGVDPHTSTESSSSWESTLSLLQKLVGSRLLLQKVDPLTSTESSRPSHFYRKQLGVDFSTELDTPTFTESSWESTLLLRQKVVGNRTSYFDRK